MSLDPGLQEELGTNHIAFETQPSPALSAPSNSHRLTPTQHSLNSPIGEEQKELNPTRLVLSLMKLKRSPKYQDQPSDVVVEHSIDGSCRVYVQRPSQPLVQTSPTYVQSPGNRDGRWTPISTQIFLEKLRELALVRIKEHHSAASKLEIALDNCTVIYYPEDSDECEGDIERVEVLPCSHETPSDGRPYYNFSSRSTLRFITNALANRSPKRQPAEPASEGVQSTSDSSVLFIQQADMQVTSGSGDRNTPVTSVRDEDGILPQPCSAQQLKAKLEELKITGEETALDANITLIINKPSESSTPSGPASSDLLTPATKGQEVVNLMSPRTKWKLLRKLQDVQEDCEGEEEAKAMTGTRLFLPISEGASRASSHTSLVASPQQVRPFSPPHEEIMERLVSLQRERDDSSSEED